MAEHMLWCDVALSAAGGTCLELACLGVPSLVIVVADNQRHVGESVEQRALMWNLGRSEVVGASTIASALRDLLADDARRHRMTVDQRACVDGLGAERVAEALIAAASRPRAES
jgi:spore coat polysaccharide biosynthesis predicted glycosyltransferase SpsG